MSFKPIPTLSGTQANFAGTITGVSGIFGSAVGIGTNNPSAKLEVSSAPLSNQLYLKDSSDNEITHNFWIDGVGNGQLWMYGEGQGTPKIKFSTHDVSYLDGGNVGIGTTSPSAVLHCVSI